MPALEYKVVMTEPLVVVLPSDHRLASRKTIAIEEIANETFLGMSKTAPSLQVIIDDYLKRSGLFKQMSCTRHDRELLLTLQLTQRASI